MPASLLLCLPSELLIACLCAVRGLREQSTSTLSALCSTSRSIRLHAEPLLYQELDWTWTGDFHPPVHLLLRTLLNRPELINYIHHVRFNDFSDVTYRQNDTRGIMTTFTRVERTTLIGKLWDFTEVSPCYKNVSITAKCLLDGSVDPTLSILLFQLKRLKSLALRVKDTDTPYKLCDTLFTSLFSFRHLRNVALVVRRNLAFADFWDTADQAAELRDKLLAGVLFLGHIRTFECSIPTYWTPDWDTNGALLFTLTSVTLQTSSMQSLEELLRLCPKLKRLDFIHRQYNCTLPNSVNQHQAYWGFRHGALDVLERDALGYGVSKYYFNCDLLQKALNHVKETIEHISISITPPNSQSQLQYPLINGSLCGCLPNFPRLKTLELPSAVFFAGAAATAQCHGIESHNRPKFECELLNSIPPSLEELRFREDANYWRMWQWQEVEVEARIVCLMDYKEFIPRLKRVVVYSNGLDPQDLSGRPVWAGSMTIFKEAGVEVVVQKPRKYDADDIRNFWTVMVPRNQEAIESN